MHAFPILDTPRLHLREIQMDDAPQLLAIHGDAQAMKWFGIDPLTELAQAEAAKAETAATPAAPAVKK